MKFTRIISLLLVFVMFMITLASCNLESFFGGNNEPEETTTRPSEPESTTTTTNPAEPDEPTIPEETTNPDDTHEDDYTVFKAIINFLENAFTKTMSFLTMVYEFIVNLF